MKFTKTEKCIVVSLPVLLIAFIYSIGLRSSEFNSDLPEKVMYKLTDAQRINFRLQQQKTIDFDKVNLSASAFKNETWVSMARQKGTLKKGSIKAKKMDYINWLD